MTPSAIEFATAVSSAARRAAAEAHVRDRGRPGLHGWPVTQLMPAMTPEFEPEPLQLSTRTATSVTALATP